MRKLASIIILSSAILMSGCATFGGGTSAPPTWDEIVKQVQQGAVAVCSFMPTAQTVIDILSLGSPALATASQVAGAICAAVVAAPRSTDKRSATLPAVGGVVVRGYYTR